MIGWVSLSVDEDGELTNEETGYVAECFIFLFWILWVGDPVTEDDYFDV